MRDKSKLRRLVMPLKLGFFQRITVHIVLMTFLTGLLITGVTAFHFHREIYRLEFDSTYMVYTATINYLTAHHRTHNQYNTRSIDYVFKQKFLLPEDSEGNPVSHRPQQLTLYDENGQVIYTYDEKGGPPPPNLDADEWPVVFTQVLDKENGVIRLAGPVSTIGTTPGYISMAIPTQVPQHLGRLLAKALVTVTLILALTVGLSLVFTRQALAPIKALTRAARSMHRGELDQTVMPTSDDEIGELTQTFNDMVRSMSRRMDFMHRMQEWTVRIGRQLNAQPLFDIMGEMFERMSAADAYRLYLMDPETKRLEVRLENGSDLLPAPDDDHLARMSLDERWTMYLKEDGSTDSEPTQVAELAIPLLSGTHRIGVIRIGRKADRALYDDDTLTILQTLAQHASVAIDNARLYERLSAQERLAQEMTLARDIQQAMFPRSPPVVPGYEIAGGGTPALEVGGDYFDYVQQDDCLYTIIADVSGKGMPAALIMSIVRALVHTYLEFENSPGRILCKVNRNISRDLEPEMFVTMSVLQLDPVRHQLRIGRAGHEPIMIMHGDGTVDNLEPRGTALGMLDVESFDEILEETVCAIHDQDTILLYTDGITEAQNETEEEFGYDRLEVLVREHLHLPVNELYQTILNEIQSFTHGVPQHDDITLILLRRNDATV